MLYYATRDPELGCFPKVVAAAALAYALSPLDLIPDFIPVLGLVDDLLIVPGLIVLAVWLMPPAVWEHARTRAEEEPLRLRDNWGAVLFVFVIWDAALLGLVYALTKQFGTQFWKRHWWVAVVSAGGVAVLCEGAWCAVQLWRHSAAETGSAGDSLLPAAQGEEVTDAIVPRADVEAHRLDDSSSTTQTQLDQVT